MILALVVVVLSRGSEAGWTGSETLILAVMGIALLALLVLVERRSAYPIIDPVLFRSRSRSMAYLATTLMSVAQSAVALLISLFLQVIQGASALDAGLRIMPLAGCIMLASPIAGRLATHIEPRKLSSAGFGITSAGLLALGVGLDQHSSFGFLVMAMAAVGFGCGIFQAPNTASLMATIPADKRGIASAMRSTLQCTGQVVSTALSLTIVTMAAPRRLRQAFFSGTLNRGSAAVHTFVAGFRTVFLVLFVLSLSGITASILRGDVLTEGARAAEGLANAPAVELEAS